MRGASPPRCIRAALAVRPHERSIRCGFNEARISLRPKSSKRASSRSRTMLQALIEGAPDLLTLIDRDRVVRYVSPAVTRVTGYESGELLGRPFVDLLQPADLEGAHRAFDELLAGEDVIRVQTRFRHKDGRWITLES